MSSTTDLSGSLSFLTLGDIIQLIGSNGSTGILRVLSKYAPEPGLIYYNKGNIVHAAAGTESGMKAAFDLFGWIDGEFEFICQEEVKCSKTITKNRMEIILDGLRMLDDGQTKKLGAVSFQEQLAQGADHAVDYGRQIEYPVVKGPIVDYIYVVSEDEFTLGQTIFEEKSHGSWNWTILEGMVDVFKHTKDGMLKLYRAGDGAFIGSIDSLSYQGGVRTLTATAAGKVQLGVLDTQRLTTEYTRLSLEFRNMIRSLEKRFNQVTQRAVDLYLKKDNTTQVLKNKKMIMRQSSSELKNFFIIQAGEAFIVQHTDFGPLLLARLEEGDFIGKIPFMDIGHEPMSASVFATQDFKARKSDLVSLRKEFDKTPLTIQSMIENVTNYIMITTRVAHDFQKKMTAGKK